MRTILDGAHEVTTAADPTEAMGLLDQRPFDVLLTDVRMPGASGFDLLAAAKKSPSDPSVVMMTGYASIPDAIEAIRRGAFDYVSKPPRRRRSRSSSRARPSSARAPRRAAASRSRRWRASSATRSRSRATEPRATTSSLLTQFHGNVTRAATHAGMTREPAPAPPEVRRALRGFKPAAS